jgi:hypothetical protein
MSGTDLIYNPMRRTVTKSGSLVGTVGRSAVSYYEFIFIFITN